jgi:hypothetical protein
VQAKETQMTAMRMRMRVRLAATPRDQAVTALILAIAAMAWFGWGQAEPPAAWSLPLTIGTFAAIAVAVGAGVIVARVRRCDTAMADPAARRGYGITVGTEAAACALGAAALGLTGQSPFIASWILLVVGVHFLPLGRLFGSAQLLWAGPALAVVAVAATVTGMASDVAPSAVTGAFGGLVCIACATACLWSAVRDRTVNPSSGRNERVVPLSPNPAPAGGPGNRTGRGGTR